MSDRSFDEWKELFEKDPEEFERVRQQFLEEYIETQYADEDEKQRARAILWRMEQNYRHIKDPIERFNMVVAEFWKQVHKFNDALHYMKDEL